MKIQIENLTKSFFNKPVFNSFSLEVNSGEKVGLFGPNGSGKTTLLKMISGIMSIDSGEIKIDEMKIHPEDPESRKCVHYMGHSIGLYPGLTGKENISFVSKLYNKNEAGTQDALSSVGLREDGKKLVKFYSQGMLQRLKLATASVLSPNILLLDEPKTGLDEDGNSILEKLFTDWKHQKKTMVIVAHDRDWLSEKTDRIVELN